MGHVTRRSRGLRRRLLVRAGGEASLGRAVAGVGREVEFSFMFSVNLLMIIQFSFKLNFDNS